MKLNIIRQVITMSKYALIGLFVQCFCCSMLIAKDGSAQGKKLEEIIVSVSLDNVTLKHAFKTIGAQTDFDFAYNDNTLDEDLIVSASAENESLAHLLGQISRDASVKFKRINNIIYVKEIKRAEKEPEVIEEIEGVTISGIVTSNEDNMPLPGVSVLIKGTTQGTVTDVQGKYSLNVPAGSTLQFSYIGFTLQEVAVGSQTTINISLIPDLSQLEEVVVVGYGTQKKSDLTGSISQVKSEDLVKTTALGVDQALQGKAAGVNIMPRTGSPGAGATIRIRGVGTVNNSDPYILIDGIPSNDLVSLNMNDVASIEVLKDASATAIYGSRGSNGVILITTKSGKKGKAKISYDTYFGTQERWKGLDLMDGPQYATYRNKVREMDNAITMGRTDLTEEEKQNMLLPALPELADPSSMPTYDWGGLAYQSGQIQNHQLSVSGGSDNMTYYLSYGYTNQEGILKYTGYKRHNIRLNNTYKMHKNVEIGHNITYAHSERKTVPEYGVWPWDRLSYLGYVWEPTVPFYDEEGNPTISNYQTAKHPAFTAQNRQSVTTQQQVLASAYININFLKDFTFRSTAGADMRLTQRNQLRDPYDYASNDQRTERDIDFRNNYSVSPTWTNTLTYNKTFADKHKVSLLVGSELLTYYTNNINLVATGFASVLASPNISDAVSAPALGTQSEQKQHSYLSRLTYNYDNRYLATFNFRSDGSGNFGKGDRMGHFPSISLAWNVHNEGFFGGLDFINELKIRGGWGRIGNQNIKPFLYEGRVQAGGPTFDVTFGNQKHTGAGPISIGNSLHWETTETANFGFDLGLLDDKVLLTADYFVKTTTNMLFQQSDIPKYVGIRQAPWVNGGEIENKGLELTASYNTKIGDVSLDISGNVSFIRNNVVSMLSESGFQSAGSFAGINGLNRTQAGYPLAQFWGLNAVGIFQTQAEIDGSSQPNARPGDVIYEDIDGSGTIDAGDNTIIGDPFPDFTYGFNIGASYKGFDLSAFFQGSQGNDIFGTGPYFFEMQAYSNNYAYMATDAWSGEGTSNSIPRPSEIYGAENYRMSSRYVFDGSYLRLKNLQIGYTLPDNITEKLHIDKLRVYVGGQNLFTIHNYEQGMDPEVGQDVIESNPLHIGIDRGVYPQARSMIMGLNVAF